MKLHQAPELPDSMSRHLGHKGKSGKTIWSPAVPAHKSPWVLASLTKRASGHDDERAVINVEHELGSMPVEGSAPPKAEDDVVCTTGSRIDDNRFTIPKSPAKVVVHKPPSDIGSTNRYSPLTPVDYDEDDSTIRLKKEPVFPSIQWDDVVVSEESGLDKVSADWLTKPLRATSPARYTADEKWKAPIHVHDELDRELATSLLYASDNYSDAPLIHKRLGHEKEGLYSSQLEAASN